MSVPAAVAPAAPEALDPAALFRPFLTGRESAVAAVSGGSDSLALLVLLNDFRRASPGLTLTVVTVDHGLRPEAAAEARRVAELAARLGFPHRTLRWQGAKPRTGLIAAAREARYRLLAQAAREAGADMVLTGHTADDQVETVLMRMARANGEEAGRGLAGMAPFTLREGRAWIARPLLGIRRETLRRHLRALGIAWTDDPTNADPRFERARLRREPPDAAGAERLLRLAREAAVARAVMAEQAAHLVRAYADRPLPGLLRLSPAFAAAPDRPAAMLALRFLLAAAGGRVRPVEEPRADALLAALAAPCRRTLGGAVAERRRDALFLRREMRGVAEVEFGEGAVFDNRYGIFAEDAALRNSARAGKVEAPSVPGPRPQGRVVAQGDAAGPDLPELPAVPPSLARGGAGTQPAFRHADGRIVSLAEAGLAAEPVVAPFMRFLPGFDLPLAEALRALVGAPPLPSPPVLRPSAERR